MRRALVTALLFSIPAFASAQESADAPKAAVAPATKLEAFSARTGIVLIKGYSKIGSVSHTGTVNVDVREFRDASNLKSAQYGVALEVKELGRIERENTSYIDEDEIDSLIRGLDYISRIQPGVTSLSNFEAQYRTKGDLAVTVFSSSTGDIKLAVSSGRIGKTNAFLPLSDAARISTMLSQAKTVIATAKQASR